MNLSFDWRFVSETTNEWTIKNAYTTAGKLFKGLKEKKYIQIYFCFYENAYIVKESEKN